MNLSNEQWHEIASFNTPLNVYLVYFYLYLNNVFHNKYVWVHLSRTLYTSAAQSLIKSITYMLLYAAVYSHKSQQI